MRPPERTLEGPGQAQGPFDGALPLPACLGFLLLMALPAAASVGLVTSLPCRSLQWSGSPTQQRCTQHFSCHQQDRHVSWNGAASPLHPLLHPPATAPARPVISMILAEKPSPQLPQHWGVTQAPHNHPCPCPRPIPFHPQEPCSPPSPCKLRSCLTSSEPRSHRNKQHLSPPSRSSVCPPPSASSCGSDWQCPASGACPFHIPQSHLRRTEIWLNGLYKALEITQRPGPRWKRRKTLQKSRFGQTQCFTTRC